LEPARHVNRLSGNEKNQSLLTQHKDVPPFCCDPSSWTKTIDFNLNLSGFSYPGRDVDREVRDADIRP
jgi:hypothetical protein